MNSAYASKTSVTVSRSRDEIERVLLRFGATAQMWGRDDEVGIVLVRFRRRARGYEFRLQLPRIEEFELTPTGKYRSKDVQLKAREQEERRRFRSLANYIKATLDAVDSGIIDFETAFLPHLLLPTGETLARRLEPEIERALEGGPAPSLGLALGPGSDTQLGSGEAI